MAQLEGLLRERTGLDSPAVGPGAVERAVRARMLALQMDDLSAYRTVLQTRPTEFQALVEAVVVPETSFFRHPEALTAMARFAVARLFSPTTGARQTRLRVLSIPCSTGEEPYSIAMALFDAGVPAERFHVDAVDISTRVLDQARRAVYGANAFRGEALGFRDRYFVRTGSGHALDGKVRAQVTFASGNLLESGLLAGEPPYDFVFCRNLLIYFDAPTQQRALLALRRLLRPDGVLFVGPAETHLVTRGGFATAGVPLAFAFLIKSTGAQQTMWPARAQSPAPGPSQSTGTAGTRLPPPRPARPMPSATAPRPPVAAPAKTQATGLEDAVRLADAGRIDDALAACQEAVRREPSATAYCLLGVLYDAGHRPQAARDAYRRALYLDPTHQEAMHHLAALLDMEGDRAGAARLRERAQRAQQLDRAQGNRHG